MVTYKILDNKNIKYNPNLLKRLYLLYKGGYELQANADLFLSMLASETTRSFEDRKRAVAYLPYMSDIIDYYAAMLFAGEVSVTEAADADDPNTMGNEVDDQNVYKLFLSSADLKGNSLEEAIRHTMTDALVFSHAFVGIDFPKNDEVPISLLEEEVMQSARPYLYDIDPECVTDWSCNEAEKFNWVKLKSDNIVQLNPLDMPMHQIEFKIWTMENGFAKWQLFQTKPLRLDKYPAPNDDVPMVDEGITSFREIPVLKLCLPPGLAIGNKIGPICEDIFQRSSILVNGENKSVNAMRVVFLGPEAPPPGKEQFSMVQENPFRQDMVQNDWESKGFGVLGANDKMEVIESEGHAFQIVAEQIDGLIEKLKEVVHQMGNSASSVSKKAGRSAESKQEDRHATEMLLSAYGSIVRDFIKKVMICISTARSESIVWTVDGLDSFSVVDRNQLILESKDFQNTLATSKSITFSRLYTEKLYSLLLDGTSHEDMMQIRQEIMQTVTKLPEQQLESSPQDVVQDKKLLKS